MHCTSSATIRAAAAPLVRQAASLFLSGVLACGLLATTGCDNPNTMFHGTWVSTFPAYDGALVGQLEGAPVLAMGHFGQEVAGVVYFRVDAAGPLLETDCECAFLEHQSIDFDTRSVVFSTSCYHGELSAPEPLIWTLTLVGEGLDSERELSGTVRRLGDSHEELVQLLQQADFVLDEDKACPRASD